MTQRSIEANGVELCAETFGDAADPAILLVMGTGASMLWWDEEFCRSLADGGLRARCRWDANCRRRPGAHRKGPVLIGTR